MLRILLLLVLPISACESGSARAQRERMEAEAAERRAVGLQFVRDLHQGRFDLDYYRGIEIGMDLEQVTAHLGDSGKEVSRSTEGPTTTLVMEWGDETGSISVTFLDGKVSAKSKKSP